MRTYGNVTLNGWHITFNPDDDRWYVAPAADGVAVATFRERRNAIQYARTHAHPG